MKIHIYCVWLAVLAAAPVEASEKGKLETKGLIKLTHAQVAEHKIGKEIHGIAYPKKNEWTATYRKDGTKFVTWGGGNASLEWTYKEGKWCETISKKLNCTEHTYKLENTCYTFKNNGALKTSCRCR